MHAIAPFLRLDKDPYIVVSGGRLYWIQDAYTTSSWFPYAQPIEGEATNYIRNSVKIVIDAYNGSVNFYMTDPGRSGRRDLPEHLPWSVQAFFSDAGRFAKTHPLSGGSLSDPVTTLSRLSHGYARGVL